MSDSFGFFLAGVATWLAIGVVLSIVMGRRGHDSFAWLVLGAVLGPLGIVLAIDAWRHGEHTRPTSLAGNGPATVGCGLVDALVGYDGSPESAAAMQGVVELLGDRLGRLAVATVVPFGEIWDQERMAAQGLRRLADRTPGRALELEVLHGRPSAALRQRAIEGGFELIAVGARGEAMTKAVLGSAASELARDSKIPVLVVGSDKGS
jgi:nucleotide-binding universal stress UspA family protein